MSEIVLFMGTVLISLLLSISVGAMALYAGSTRKSQA